LRSEKRALHPYAVEEPDLPVCAVAVADREVAGVAPAGERAIQVLAAEAREVVHGCESFWVVARPETIGRKPHITLTLDGPQ
jgi:hypothetical protein